MNHQCLEVVSRLEALRKSRVIVYISGESPGKGIDGDDSRMLYKCLRVIGRVPRIDLVLHTEGGLVSCARKFATLLNEYGQEVNVLVPYKARSAGTLICLGAHSVVMSPLAELSPIDSSIRGVPLAGQPGPVSISSEEVRQFREFATEWLQCDQKDSGVELASILCQRLFPTTLTSFYRADRYLRVIAEELLSVQLPKASVRVRRSIVEKLVGYYADHSHGITGRDARRFGLCVKLATGEEEELLYALYEESNEYINGRRTAECGLGLNCASVMFSGDLLSEYSSSSAKGTPSFENGENADQAPATSRRARAGGWMSFPKGSLANPVGADRPPPTQNSK
jgi:hypothetical protein